MTTGERRIRLDVAYDGGAFAGWQLQPNERTVQGVLESALGRVHGRPRLAIRGAGRTDSGVHAWGQVADALVDTRLDDDDLLYALRRVLPDDVRPLSLVTVDPSFHSRKQAVEKTYLYRLDLSRHADPFLRRFALHHPQPLDRGRLEAALASMPGRRDWSGFTTPACDKEHRERDLREAFAVEPRPGELCLAFRADGFLRYMVRLLVGTALEIARGRETLDVLRARLEAADPEQAGPAAQPHGLHLLEVLYPGETRSFERGDAVGWLTGRGPRSAERRRDAGVAP